jgi:hypothetical protein
MTDFGNGQVDEVFPFRRPADELPLAAGFVTAIDAFLGILCRVMARSMFVSLAQSTARRIASTSELN